MVFMAVYQLLLRCSSYMLRQHPYFFTTDKSSDIFPNSRAAWSLTDNDKFCKHCFSSNNLCILGNGNEIWQLSQLTFITGLRLMFCRSYVLRISPMPPCATVNTHVHLTAAACYTVGSCFKASLQLGRLTMYTWLSLLVTLLAAASKVHYSSAVSPLPKSLAWPGHLHYTMWLRMYQHQPNTVINLKQCWTGAVQNWDINIRHQRIITPQYMCVTWRWAACWKPVYKSTQLPHPILLPLLDTLVQCVAESARACRWHVLPGQSLCSEIAPARLAHTATHTTVHHSSNQLHSHSTQIKQSRSWNVNHYLDISLKTIWDPSIVFGSRVYIITWVAVWRSG